MQLFVSLWNYLRYDEPRSLQEVLVQITSHDFGVELWPTVHSFSPYVPAYHPSFPCAEGYTEIHDLFLPEHRDWLKDALGPTRSCWHSRAFDDSPKAYGAFSDYQTEIDIAAHLDSEAISVHYIGEELTVRDYAGCTTDLVTRVLDYGVQQGVSIALESLEFDSMRRALSDFPGLDVCLDPACIHAHSTHDLRDFIDVIGDRVSFLHLYDVRDDLVHLTPGSGAIPVEDWKYMFAYLKDISFTGPAVLEIRPPPERGHQSPIEAAMEARAFFDRLI